MSLNNLREFSSDRTTMVAHDLRGPLAALRALAKRPDPLGKDKEVLFLVVDRIEGITQGLLNENTRGLYPRSAGLVCEGVTVQKLSLDTKRLLREKELQVGYPSEIQFSWVGGEKSDLHGALKFRCIAQDLQRILSNLVDNSINSFTEGGSIQITFKVKLGYGVITVKDNGPGVTSELLPILGWKKVISQKAAGQGMGMFYAGELVRSWGGRFLVESNGGTCVRLILAPLRPTYGLVEPATPPQEMELNHIKERRL